MNFLQTLKKALDASPSACILNDSDKPLSVIFQNEFLIVGVNYECRKNAKKKRLDIIKKMKVGNPVIIEQYIYENTKAYMIVDPKSKLDLGVLSRNAAHWLSDYYPGFKVEAYLSDRFEDSFHVSIRVLK